MKPVKLYKETDPSNRPQHFLVIAYLGLFIAFFMPIKSQFDFGPSGREDDLIKHIYPGYESGFSFFNIILISVIRGFAELNQHLIRKILVIILTLLYCLGYLVFYIANAAGWGASPFIPSFEIGYYIMLIASLTILIQAYIVAWRKEQPEAHKKVQSAEDLLDQ